MPREGSMAPTRGPGSTASGNRHRTHRGAIGGPRQRPLRRQPRDQGPVCGRPPEPDPGISSVNRHQKVAKDPSEWLPALNECWYVDRVVQVRLKYGLTIDRAETEAIDQVLAGCESTEMVFLTQGASPTPAATPAPTEEPEVDALAMYDDNGNGRITCAEARAHGIAPVHRGHPAYEYMQDRDGDGVVCE